MIQEEITIRWTWEDGQIWANCSDGRRILTLLADPPFDGFAQVLNMAPALGARLLSGWLGVL
jgi:hypothetical protein